MFQHAPMVRPGSWPLLMRVLLILGMLTATLPLAFDRASGGEVPQNVFLASVRLALVLRVTPDNTSTQPFHCVIDQFTGDTSFSSGSGTIFDPRGFVLTNAHVVIEEVSDTWMTHCTQQIPGGGTGRVTQEIIAYLPNEQGIPTDVYTAELVKSSDPTVDDLAVVRLVSRVDEQPMPDAFPFVRFGDSNMLDLGAEITVLGYPGGAGRNLSVTKGIFSGLTEEGEFSQQRFKTDAVISGGNSGGTAIDAGGLLIGIPSNSFWSDCRPHEDTNGDGKVDSKDACRPLGGSLSVLIPSRLGHAFAEQALGETLPLLPLEDNDGGSTPAPPAEQSPTPTSEPGPTGTVTIALYALDGIGLPLPVAEDVNQLKACVEGDTIAPGETVHITWSRDGRVIAGPETFTWDAAWGPELCLHLFSDRDDPGARLTPGTYQAQIVFGDSTLTSETLAVNTASTMPAATPTPTERANVPHFSDPAYLDGRIEMVTDANGWLVRGTADDIPRLEGDRWGYRVGQVPAGANLVAVADLCQKSALTTVPLLFGVVLWNSPTGVYALVDSGGVTISRNDGSGFVTLSTHRLDTVNVAAGECNRFHLILENGTLSIWVNSAYVTSIEGIEMHPWAVDLGVWQAANSARIDNPSEPVMSYQTLWLGTFPSP